MKSNKQFFLLFKIFSAFWNKWRCNTLRIGNVNVKNRHFYELFDIVQEHEGYPMFIEILGFKSKIRIIGE